MMTFDRLRRSSLMKSKFDRLNNAAGALVSVLSVLVMLMLLSAAVYADDTAAILEPQHGIPLVIVNIDESEEGIAAARAGDPQHEYGTMKDMNTSEKHSVRCVGSVTVKVPEGYELPDGSSAWVDTDLRLEYIRGRGNSTWNSSKKPYKVQLSKKADLFGMGKSKEWALMANYNDNTTMHNRITSWLGRQMGMPYTAESIPVDVVMTGADGPVYLGLYDLSETVKIEDSRVAIDKLGKQPDDTAAAGGTDHQKTGGYLFSVFTSYQKDDPESNTFTTKNKLDFHFDSPEFMDEDSLTGWQKEQRQYLRDNVQYIEDLIVDCDEIDKATHDKIAEVLDLESVADYWLVQEFSQNGDAYLTGSTYFFKPRGDRLHFGPLWDFDLAWGRMSADEDADNDQSVQGFNYTQMLWIDELRAKAPEFVRIIEKEWAKMDPALTQLTKSGGILDQYRNEIRGAYNSDPEIADMDENDLEVNTDDLRRWIDARHKWMRDNIDKVGALYVKLTFIADGEVVYVNKRARFGEYASDDPEAPEKEGLYFVGWFTEDGTALNEVSIEKDTVFYAKYKGLDEAVLPTDLYLQEYEVWAEEDSLVGVSQNYTIVPSDSVIHTVTWTSEDTSIASVDDAGYIFAHKAGDVTLTATTANGVEAKLLLHVVGKGELNPRDPKGIAAEEQEISLKTGESTQTKWHYLPEGEPIKNNYYSFESSDDQVADVNSMGVITAVSPGTAEITMTVFCGDDEDEEKISVVFHVTVTDPEAPEDADDPAKGGSENTDDSDDSDDSDDMDDEDAQDDPDDAADTEDKDDADKAPAAVNTGDENQLPLWLTLMSASLIGLMITVIIRRRQTY